jgi:antitoxin component of MazEF toxin-antitoxin module
MTFPTRFKIEKWDDDLAFRIPDETAAALDIREGDDVALEREGATVWVRFTRPNQPPNEVGQTIEGVLMRDPSAGV